LNNHSRTKKEQRARYSGDELPEGGSELQCRVGLPQKYYITPSGKVGADAFAVIRDAMKDKDRVALAKIVIAHREHIIALDPRGKGLLGTTLRYDYEVRDEKEYFSGVTSPRVGKDMVSLAAHILEPRKRKSICVNSRTSTRPQEADPAEPRGGMRELLRRGLASAPKGGRSPITSSTAETVARIHCSWRSSAPLARMAETAVRQ
jgi:hypothetical protein